MKKAIISIITIATLLIVAICYKEYVAEKDAISIYNSNYLQELPKKEAIKWVHFNVSNSTTKWYLIKIIEYGEAPDSISIWKESKYINNKK